MKLPVYTIDVVNQSSREGARIHGLVLHTTESPDHPTGNADLVAIGQEFNTSSAQASAHLAVNLVGNFARYVPDDRKAWAVCDLNRVTLNLEQIGYAEFSRAEWFARHAQLHGAAEFLAYGHTHYGVPLEKGEAANGAITRAGVFQHKDFGLPGSGHTDCGDGYPQGYVTLLAQYFIADRLHPGSIHAEHLRKKINAIRIHHRIAKLP